MDISTYRMVVTSGHDYVTTGSIADEQLRAWLRDAKHYDTRSIDEGRTTIGEGARLDSDFETGLHGAHSRWRLRENAADGLWQTTLLVRSRPADTPWVRLEVEHLPAGPDARTGWADTPGLAAPLLTALAARDGRARVSPGPTAIEIDDLDRVFAELRDGARRLPLVIVSTPQGMDQDDWLAGTAALLLRHLPGLAVPYVLTAKAEAAFNRELAHHRVLGGDVRSYLPGVDPASRADGYRHPTMSRGACAEDPAGAARLLARLPQRLAVRSPLPPELAAPPALRTRAAEPEDAPELDRLRADNTVLSGLLDEAAHEERSRLTEISHLRLELRDREEHVFDLTVELEERSDELRHSAAHVRELQRQLVELGAAATAFGPPEPAEPRPAGFEALLDRVGELPELRFTGHRRTTVELDVQALGSDWVATAWDAVLAFRDYVLARRSGAPVRDFLQWCRETPAGGHGFPPGKVVRDESPQTAGRKAWHQQRTFPVPVEVDPAGEVFMGAHLRIGAGNSKAPRLHFHDDTLHGGPIYIGYLGPHLNNTLSAGI